MLDSEGILRVGGRLDRVNLPTGEKTPVLVPGKHHIANLLYAGQFSPRLIFGPFHFQMVLPRLEFARPKLCIKR